MSFEYHPPFCGRFNRNSQFPHQRGRLQFQDNRISPLPAPDPRKIIEPDPPAKVGRRFGLKRIIRSCLSCKLFEDFCNETSIHGFNHIVAPKRHILEKLGWLAATLLAALGALQLCLEQWQRYVASPTVVALEKDYRSWNNSFLALTACQDVRYSNVAIAFVHKTWGVREGDEKFQYYLGFVKVVADATITNLGGFKEYANDPTLNDVDLFQLSLEITPPFKGLVAWFDRSINVSFVNVMTELGVCHTINSIVSRDQLIKLRQDINTPPSAEVVSCQYITHPCYMRIELYEVCSTYYAHSPYDLADLSTGRVARLCPGQDDNTDWKVVETMAAQDIKALSVEQRKCRFHEEPHGDKYQVYSSSICRRMCRNKIALKLCGCRPYFYFQEAGPACGPAGLACLDGKKVKEELLRLVGCSCQPQCVDATFELSSLKESRWSGPFASRSSIKVGILPPRSRYRRQILFYFEDLVVSFGGAAGLFLGCSFLSGVEIVYFLLERLLLAIRNLVIRQPRKTSDPAPTAAWQDGNAPTNREDDGFVFRKYVNQNDLE